MHESLAHIQVLTICVGLKKTVVKETKKFTFAEYLKNDKKLFFFMYLFIYFYMML